MWAEREAVLGGESASPSDPQWPATRVAAVAGDYWRCWVQGHRNSLQRKAQRRLWGRQKTLSVLTQAVRLDGGDHKAGTQCERGAAARNCPATYRCRIPYYVRSRGRKGGVDVIRKPGDAATEEPTLEWSGVTNTSRLCEPVPSLAAGYGVVPVLPILHARFLRILLDYLRISCVRVERVPHPRTTSTFSRSV